MIIKNGVYIVRLSTGVQVHPTMAAAWVAKATDKGVE